MKSVLTENKHLVHMKEVLKKEAEGILKLSSSMGDEMAQTVESILACKGRVIITGVGKSGLIGGKLAATLASTGTPAFFIHPTEGLHGDLGMVTDSDIVLALSKSGETEEVIRLLPSIKRIGAKLIAFVGNRHSTLADLADHILAIGDSEEACPLGLAPTTSTTVMLALGDAIAIALAKARNFSREDFAIFHPGGSLGKKLLFTVKTIMDFTKRNPVIRHTDTIEEAIFNMTNSGLGATSVVDEHGKLIGIITDGDIRKELAKGADFKKMPIADLYSRNAITITADALAAEALNIMEGKKINVLPVVNENAEPIAMIHLHDITRVGI